MQKLKELLRSAWRYIVYKPNGKSLNLWRITMTLAYIGLGVYAISQYFSDNRLQAERDNNPRYTVGTTTDYYTSKRRPFRSTNVNFIYSISGNKYSGLAVISWLGDRGSINKKGGRYFVKFASNNPSNAEILFDSPVPNYSTNIPDTGWVEIPKPFTN